MGVGVEAFTFKALKDAWQNAKNHEYREHINDYFLAHRQRFAIDCLACLPFNHCPNLHLTVDTLADFNFVELIASRMSKPLTDCSTREIIDWWKSNRLDR